MILKGQKRKLPPEDVVVSVQSGPLWESQRQFVFSVSLNKYQQTQELAEPSLRRSVLIANTLRQISLDASTAPPLDEEVSPPEREGVPSGAERQSAVSVLGDCPEVSVNRFQTPASAAEDDEDWGSMSTESDFSLSAAISSILTALDSTVDAGPQAALRTPLRSLENLSGACKGGVALAKQEIRDSSWDPRGESKERSAEVARTHHVDDVTMEDLFQEIDKSQLERDMGVLGLQSGGGGAPFSFSLNTNLKCLPSFSFSPLPSSSSSSLSSPGSAPFSGPGQAREGLELDQLMEILVES